MAVELCTIGFKCCANLLLENDVYAIATMSGVAINRKGLSIKALLISPLSRACNAL